MLKKFLHLSLVIILASISIPAAKAEYDYNGDTMNYRLNTRSFSLFPRHFYTVQIFNNPMESESKFTLRLASHGEVAGCATMSKGSVKKEYASDKIRLKVLDPQLRVNKRAPRYSHTDCDVNINKSSFDVEFDRDDLIDRGIKHIALHNQIYGEFFTSDVNISKEKLELTVKSAVGDQMVTFWFMPQDSVILHTPHSKRETDVKTLIEEFGREHGLIPLTDMYRKFELPFALYNYVVFTDPTGHIVSKINSYNDVIPIGSIHPTRTVQTASGPVEETYDLVVHASLPGLEEEDR